MKCINCLDENPDDLDLCPMCGFDLTEEKIFYEVIREYIDEEPAEELSPWRKSSKSGTFSDWVRLHIPLVECINTSGSFLDISCANGFLLECLLEWTRHKGLALMPFGLDHSFPVLESAKSRLPEYRDNFFLGNAWEWIPPRQFDYVRTDLSAVPASLRESYIQNLLDNFVAPGGKILVSQQRNHHEDLKHGWITDEIASYGYPVERYTRGFNWDGLELSRVAVLRK